MTTTRQSGPPTGRAQESAVYATLVALVFIAISGGNGGGRGQFVGHAVPA